MPEAQRHSKRHGEGFAGPVGHSANLETGRSFSQGSWHLCTPSLVESLLWGSLNHQV